MDTSEKTILQSRRDLVTGLGGIGIAATLLAAKNAQAYGGGTGISGFFDVTAAPYNAPTNGVSDAQPGIQAAINAAQSNGGGVVWLPPGVYKLNSGLVITAQIELCGAGWSTPTPDVVGTPNNSTGNGTWLSVSSTAFTPLLIKGFGTIVRGLAFIHQQVTSITSTWSPVNYPYAIEINAADTLVENVFFRNATRGITIKGATSSNSVGRVTLKHIWGQPIISGISVDNAADVVKIDDVHFWPFWSYYSVVVDYMRSGDCRGLTLARADLPYLTNIFLLYYHRGFYFTSSTGTVGGITSGFMMSNCSADGTINGIEVDGAGTTGSVTNFYSLGGVNGGSGIVTNANGVVLQCSNLRLRIYNTSCVYINGLNSTVTLESIWCDTWNQTGAGFAAIAAVNGATVMVGRSRIFTNPGGAQFATGGTPAGTIVQDA